MAQLFSDDFKTRVRRANVERLRTLDVRSGEDMGIQGGMDDGEELEGYMEDLRKWVAATQQQRQAAMSTKVFTGKGPINMNNIVQTFLQNAAISIRVLEKVKSAAAAAKEGDDEKAMKDLMGADEHITEIAQLMGLDYVTICDLPMQSPEGHWALVGPFCGMFYSQDTSNPFIGITFKGTNQNNSGEVQVDMQRQLQKLDGLLFGSEVSKGVSNALFSPYSALGGRVAYDYIAEECFKNAQERDVPYTVHVTGHSLGASYATMFYAEFLSRATRERSGGATYTIGDLYSFGSPRIAGEEFCQNLKNLVDNNVGGTRRIVNDGDPITILPPAPGGSWLIPDPDPSVYYHINGGRRISPTAPSEDIESELGKPGVEPSDKTLNELLADIGTKHMPRPYWNALVNAAGIDFPPSS